MRNFLIVLVLFAGCSGNTTKEEEVKSTVVVENSVNSSNIKEDPGFIANGAAKTQEFYDPKLYSVLDSAEGDLNLDDFKDKILVLNSVDEEKFPESARPLLLLTGCKDGSFKLAARNDSIVMCKRCGGVFGDPFDDVVIKKGYFSIEHYGGSAWRWSRIITFKYSKAIDNWVLYRDAGVSYHTSDPDKTEDIVTNKEDYGKLTFAEFNNQKGF